MNEPHATKLELMRELAGELDPERSRVLREHAGTCLDCRRRREELAAVQAEGRASAPPLPVMALRRPARARWTALAGVISAAAAIMLIAVLPAGGVRTKGGDNLQLTCKAPGSTTVRRCASGDVVAPGTAVMFHAELGGDRYLMLLGRSSGPWRTYFPREGTAAVRVEASTRDFMSASLVLDGTPGDEELVLLVSERGFDRADVGDVSAPPEHIRAIRVVLEEGER